MINNKGTSEVVWLHYIQKKSILILVTSKNVTVLKSVVKNFKKIRGKELILNRLRVRKFIVTKTRTPSLKVSAQNIRISILRREVFSSFF